MILEGLDWLGLEFDGETVYQGERAARHAEVAHKLLDAGRPISASPTQEELAEMREAQKAAKQPYALSTAAGATVTPPRLQQAHPSSSGSRRRQVARR